MDGFAVRLKEAREAVHLTQEGLADALNAVQTTVASWERGKNEPALATIAKIAKRVKRSPQWLAFGTGDDPSPDAIRVDELDVRAMAGAGGLDVEVWSGAREAESRVASYYFPASDFRGLYGAAADRVRIIEVLGDSMEPTLRPGQRVMIDVQDRSPSPPGLFVLWDGLGMIIKRVEFVAHSDPAAVRIASDNPRYPEKERLLGEAYIQGRVIGSWERR